MTMRVVVLGAGPGGYIAAVRAAQLGAEVTVIEQDNVGGACLNWGCIPSKVMKTTAELLEKLNKAREFGIQLQGGFRPDMKALNARKETVIRNQREGILRLFRHHKIRYLRGAGAVQSAGLAVVQVEGGEILELPWDRLIVATGSRPLQIPLLPFDGERILSSNEALYLDEIPAALLIVGGGVIGCEFAFIFSSLGSKVTLVEAMSRLLPLPSIDDTCSELIQREMKKRKIDFMVNRTVERVEENGKKLSAAIGPAPFVDELEAKKMKTLTVEADKVLVCVGRTPNTTNLGMESLGVRMDERGWIGTNERMETSAPRVYAIGDVLGPSKIMLAHVASSEGLVAAENAMGGEEAMKYEIVPGAVFTTPEVANVGLTEAQAKSRGYNARSDSVLFRNLGKAQVIGEIAGEAKIVSDAENGRILGVHMVGAHATDLIAEAALAVKVGITVRELAQLIHAHPTLAEVMREASFKSLDRALHG